ncbi:MAG: ribonuclease P protein component [Gammaproteobacteria bacterium]|nr:ribonuclease P protein component [Gammaproteobacteria bacterium]MDH5310021.1 ribonuclease P protein component [Gammaproteobacteria bacterium]
MTTNKGTPTGNDERQKFPKTSRLGDPESYRRVFKQAKRSRDSLFTVLCRTNGLEIGRLGMAISKKNCRRATGRNRIKRLVRESFRHNRQTLTGIDLVVLNTAETQAASKESIRQSLDAHWKRCSRMLASGPETR